LERQQTDGYDPLANTDFFTQNFPEKRLTRTSRQRELENQLDDKD